MNMRSMLHWLTEAGVQSRFLLWVVAPTLIIACYLAVVASPGYVAHAQLVIEHDEGMAMPELDIGLFSLGGESKKVDAMVLRQHMQSRAMLDQLQQAHDLRAHYGSNEIDWLQRLPADASAEEMVEYFEAKLQVDMDPESYVLSVEVVAFDPEFAHRLAQSVVAFGEDFVNKLSQNLAKQQLSFIQAEVESAHARLKQASRALMQLQEKTSVFSPEAETQAAGAIVGTLLAELTKQRTQARALSGYLNEEAPELVMVRQQIRALEDQLAQERAQLVGAGERGLNDVLLQYQDAEVDMKLATELYKNALASLEKTRMDAARKVKFLLAVSPPVRPEEAEHPRALYWTFTAFVALSLLFFISNLLVATIRDHRE